MDKTQEIVCDKIAKEFNDWAKVVIRQKFETSKELIEINDNIILKFKNLRGYTLLSITNDEDFDIELTVWTCIPEKDFGDFTIKIKAKSTVLSLKNETIIPYCAMKHHNLGIKSTKPCKVWLNWAFDMDQTHDDSIWFDNVYHYWFKEDKLLFYFGIGMAYKEFNKFGTYRFGGGHDDKSIIRLPFIEI